MARPLHLRYVGRMLRRNSTTSVLAVLALGLGIGLTTTMFGFVYGVLLSRIPFDDPVRLVDVAYYDLEKGAENGQSPRVSIHDFLDWREQQTSFEALAASTSGSINLNDEVGYPERFDRGLVTWNTFRTLGVEPVLGRGFDAKDQVPGAPPVVLLGHDMWRNRFASDPGVVGQTVRIDGSSTTVIGVMPRDFTFPVLEALWQPMSLDVSEIERGEGGFVTVIGRLRGGASREAAQAEFGTIAARLAKTYPRTNAGRGIRVQEYRQSLNSKTSIIALGVMFSAVCLVLVIACANVASLLLARASLRARELAVHTALGAQRRQVISLLVAESLVLSAVGSAFGLALAHLGTTALKSAYSWQALPFWISFDLQPSALVFVTAVGMAAGLLAGLLPALKASGAVTFDVLKDETRSSPSLRIGGISRGLVVGELAMACALLVATGLLIRTVINYHDIDPGFATESILTASLTLPASDYPTAAETTRFFQRLVDDLRELPEVEVAAVMSKAPGTYMGESSYVLEGQSFKSESEYPAAPRGVVSPEFFETFEIPLLEGRGFTRFDTADSQPVVVVNESFARQSWGGESAIGQRLRAGTREDAPLLTVVGVTPDAGISRLNPKLIGGTSAGFYIPHAQSGRAAMAVAVKTRGGAAAFSATLREHVSRLDPALPVDAERTMQRVVWEETFTSKVMAVFFSLFGAVALALASVGIFGVMMFSVQQRTREIGVRMALGANPNAVLGLVMRQGMGRLLIGLGLGLLLAAGLASSLKMALYGVEPGDPVVFLGTVVVLAAVALAACFIPAWHASRVDPLVALHYE